MTPIEKTLKELSFTKEELNFLFKQNRNSIEIIKKNNGYIFAIKRAKLIKKYVEYKKEKPNISDGKIYLTYEEFKDYLKLYSSSED